MMIHHQRVDRVQLDRPLYFGFTVALVVFRRTKRLVRRREPGADDASPATPMDHEAYEAFGTPEDNESDSEAEVEGPVP
jgi:hypothetical protein